MFNKTRLWILRPCPNVMDIFFYSFVCHTHVKAVLRHTKQLFLKTLAKVKICVFSIFSVCMWSETRVLSVATYCLRQKNAPTSLVQHVSTLGNNMYALRALSALSIVQAFFARLFLEALSLVYVEHMALHLKMIFVPEPSRAT